MKKNRLKVFWYFKTEAVQYGVGIKDGEVYNINACFTQSNVRARTGFPVHFSPTAKLSRGLVKAKAWIKAQS